MRAHFLAIVALLCLVACGTTDESQKGLVREVITIDTASGPVRFNVELADTMERRERGLMFRMEMAPNDGMLFVYDRPQQMTFWMHNTYLPLDMIFVRANGTISS